MVIDDTGRLQAWPIIGVTGWVDHSFLSDCKSIAERTDVPLETVDESDFWGKRWRAQEERGRRALVWLFGGRAEKAKKDRVR
jgi:hypothetical protein